jgi:fermentation-respiration switch protein FrsA (DUF1100 family)
MRILRIVIVVVLVVAVGYFGYLGFEGSDQLVNLADPNRDCRTPAQIGIAYEAINYDIATDTDLAGREPDMLDCSAPGAAPGEALVSSDGVRLAGWYVPAASGIGPEGPTVVISHGYNDSKSGMLQFVPFFHDAFNLVVFDYRNHNQSADSQTTQGINEQLDLAAVLDWVVEAKAPDTIVVWAQSMGGHTAVNVVADDPRVDALVLDSTHDRLDGVIAKRIRNSGYPFGEVGYLAVALGSWLRTGVNIIGDDPITAVDDLGARPLLLIHAGADDTIDRSDADEMLQAAQAAGVHARLEVCADAGHGDSSEVCATDYRSWIDTFLEPFSGG